MAVGKSFQASVSDAAATHTNAIQNQGRRVSAGAGEAIMLSIIETRGREPARKGISGAG